jgi:hypothetical protein
MAGTAKAVRITVILLRYLVMCSSIALWLGPIFLVRDGTHNVILTAVVAAVWTFIGYPLCLWLVAFSPWSQRTLWDRQSQPPAE